MTTPPAASVKQLVGSGALAAYLKEMGKSGLLLGIPGSVASLERLYGTKGPLAALSSIPHSPASSILQTREAVLNKLIKNEFRTDTKLEGLARLINTEYPNSRLVNLINKHLKYTKPTSIQHGIANAAATADTAVSFIPLPLVSDMLRPSKYLEAKALHGNAMYNMVPLYSTHRYIAAPKAEELIIKHLAEGNTLSQTDKKLLTLLANRKR
jgi:hypothetical protein